MPTNTHNFMQDSVAGAPAAFQQLVFDDSLDVERLTSIHHHITGEVEGKSCLIDELVSAQITPFLCMLTSM